jgi:hypothetical protein
VEEPELTEGDDELPNLTNSENEKQDVTDSDEENQEESVAKIKNFLSETTSIVKKSSN